jgi:ribosomal protein S18 acetylase RimI-like enzyme
VTAAPGQSAPPRLRRGTPGDLAAVSALQLASWRDAYRGLLPDAYLDGALAADLDAVWRRKLDGAPAPRSLLLVAEAAEGSLAGFLYACQEAAGAQSAYLDNLHVRPEWRGAGLGARLMRAAVPELSALGYGGLHLRVFAQNTAALRFYERLGGRIAERSREDLMGHPADTYRIVWPVLADLA